MIMLPHDLVKEAIRGRENAYAPYSGFLVGAAVVTTSGKVYRGCNVENVAYSPTNCAERTAIFKAISEGEREFAGVAVVADTESVCTPCGVCRQVLAEFLSSETPIYLANLQGDIEHSCLAELLPGAFSKQVFDGE